nr:hypothetical protein [Tanacetum cinerariifolium]
MNMATTIEQQVALDEALVPSTQRLRIGISNFRLPSDIQSKESTLQAVYDVLHRCPFFKAFLVTTDVPEIYIKEFWATAYVHQYSIRFKMDSKKNIVNLETFRDMLHICPRVPGQSFDELPFKEEILDFLSFRLSQAQILWGLYHKRNIDYAFLIWEDFMYQVEHKNHKKSNEMHYPRFTKIIIHHFMSKKPSIPKRNKVNWHYVRDDIMFSTIKRSGTPRLINNTMLVPPEKQHLSQRLVPKGKRSGSDTSITPPTAIPTPTITGAVTPRLTAAAKGKQPAKAKSPSDSSDLARKEAQQLKIVLRRSRVLDVPSDDSKEDLSWNSLDDEDANAQEKNRDDNEGDEKDESDDGEEDADDDDEEEIAKTDEQDETKRGGDDDEETESDEESHEEETREEESFDPIPRTPKDSEDDGNGEDDQGLRISEEERLHEEEEADDLYRDVDINQGRGLQLSQDFKDSHVTLTPVNPDAQQESSLVSSHFVSNMLNPTSDVGMESIFTTASSPIAPLQTPTPIMTPSTIATITTISHAPIPPTIIPSEVLQNLPTFDLVFRFEDRLKSLEVNFSEFIQTNQFAEAVSNILGIVHQYMNQQMMKAVREAVQIQTDRLCDSYQRENDEFLRTIDHNIKRIIKELVKSQVKEQVSWILPRIKQSVNP